MTQTTENARPLDYRPKPRGEGPAWMRQDKLAELCVGLAWTACGAALLVMSLGWLFYHLDAAHVPWRLFAAVALFVNTVGVAIAAVAFALRASRDGLLLGVLVLTLLMAAAAYGGTYGLAASSRAASPPPRIARPLPPEVTGGEEDDTPAPPSVSKNLP